MGVRALQYGCVMFLERRCPVCRRRARHVCERCLGQFDPSGPVHVEGLDAVSSVFAYDEALGRAILAAKNQGRRDILRQFGRILARSADVAAADVVTWIPASPHNRKQRGFDQGRLLARGLCRGRTVPVERLLVRRGGQQKGLGRTERLDGLQLWPTSTVTGHVVLVDDVVTTGGSMHSAAAALRLAGAVRVTGMTIASTGWPASSRE